MRICGYSGSSCFVLMGAASRRRALRRLITERAVASQEELIRLLAERGHRVSQSTVSRDLRAIGAHKTALGETPERYVVEEVPPVHTAGLAATLALHMISSVASGNLVVIRTPPGATDLVALALDNAGLPELAGTVAGDDTVIVVAAEGTSGAQLAAILERMTEVAR